LMRTDVREHYNLEGLWGDAPQVKPKRKSRPRASSLSKQAT
jgi:hypothetical protein